MLEITLQYIPVRYDVAFLAIKQDYVPLLHCRIAFFVHVFSAIFVMIAGYTQFSQPLRRPYPLLHRRVGWLYAVVISKSPATPSTPATDIPFRTGT